VHPLRLSRVAALHSLEHTTLNGPAHSPTGLLHARLAWQVEVYPLPTKPAAALQVALQVTPAGSLSHPAALHAWSSSKAVNA
jgi:hypothetical protein